MSLDLTRARSDGLPTTPTTSYPNSPYTLASLSPHLQPFVNDPNAYPPFTSEVQSRHENGWTAPSLPRRHVDQVYKMAQGQGRGARVLG